MSGVLPADKQAAWLLESLETMGTKERSHTPIALSVRATVAATFNDVIKTVWKKGVKRLADAVPCSESAIHGFKRDGLDHPTTLFREVCEFIGVDADAVFEGKIVRTATIPAPISKPKKNRSRLEELAEFLAKTDQGDAALATLEGLARIAVPSTNTGVDR